MLRSSTGIASPEFSSLDIRDWLAMRQKPCDTMPFARVLERAFLQSQDRPYRMVTVTELDQWSSTINTILNSPLPIKLSGNGPRMIRSRPSP